jgi:hypothetical protein
MRNAISALFAAGLAVLPISAANAQYCSFPLEWPFCIAGAAINTAGAIVTAPFRPYYYGPGYYYGQGYYYGPGYYYGSGYYYPRRHHRRRHHRY